MANAFLSTTPVKQELLEGNSEMLDKHGFSNEVIQKWCSHVQAALNMECILYIGPSAGTVTKGFTNLGADSYGCKEMKEYLLTTSSKKNWDTLILAQDVLPDFLTLSPEAFHSSFGSLKQVLVVLSTTARGPSLPEASSWLWQMGFSRNMAVELWIDSLIITCAYVSGKPETRDLLETYEAEWWRLAQLSEKRRLLSVEYKIELENRVLDNRWEEFLNSRMGKFVNLIRKLRRFVKI